MKIVYNKTSILEVVVYTTYITTTLQEEVNISI